MSEQPRRKNPRRTAPALDEVHSSPQIIEQIRDITDEEFFPKYSFFDTSSKNVFKRKMDEAGDHRYSRIRGRKSADPKSFGLQSAPGSQSNKGKIRNFRPLAETSSNDGDNNNLYQQLWVPLKNTVDVILDGNMVELQWLSGLYDKVHLACNNNFDQLMFKELTELFKKRLLEVKLFLQIQNISDLSVFLYSSGCRK